MSCFVVDRDWEGVSVGKPFDKMGQHASDTAEVIFKDVEVPATHLLGQEGQGFLIAMKVFDRRRPPGPSASPRGLWTNQSVMQKSEPPGENLYGSTRL
jgi:acyl-CoA dehydrogenase